MTRITYKGLVWLKIRLTDWEFEGGHTNPDLLKLKRKDKKSGHHYFMLRGLK